MIKYKSPLRYPGGKRKLIPFIEKIIAKNQLWGGCYVEPYAGGSAIALSLLFKEYISQVIINDIDRSIYAFWHAVINETENLCRLIFNTPINLQNWKKYKKIQKIKNEHTLLELGFSTFFLNRTNRSGIINGGIIGGMNQKGPYRIDARFNKKDLMGRIQKIAIYRKRIFLYNMDALQLLSNLKQSLPAKTLIYFDPPYYSKGKVLYENHYTHDDHITVSNAIKQLNNLKWVISYDNIEPIKNIYSGYNNITYLLNYSAAKPRRGSETMIFCNDLIVPEFVEI